MFVYREHCHGIVLDLDSSHCLLQVQAKYGDFNKDSHKPGFLAKERLLPQRYVRNTNIVSYVGMLRYYGFIMVVLQTVS